MVWFFLVCIEIKRIFWFYFYIFFLNFQFPSFFLFFLFFFCTLYHLVHRCFYLFFRTRCRFLFFYCFFYFSWYVNVFTCRKIKFLSNQSFAFTSIATVLSMILFSDKQTQFVKVLVIEFSGKFMSVVVFDEVGFAKEQMRCEVVRPIVFFPIHVKWFEVELSS